MRDLHINLTIKQKNILIITLFIIAFSINMGGRIYSEKIKYTINNVINHNLKIK